MKQVIIIFFGLLLFSSCKKSNDETPIPDMTDQYKPLLIGKWVYTSKVITPAVDWDGNGSVESDVYPAMSSCQKAFFVEFTTSGGVVKQACDVPGKLITWELKEHGTVLRYVIGGMGNVSEKIISLNTTTLVTESGYESSVGVLHKVINTYAKQ